MQKLSTAPFRTAKKTERKVGKGKGKETYPGYFSNPFRSARARVRVKRPKPTCSYEFAGAAADEVAKTVWRDNANPYPGRVTGTEARTKKRKRLVPPESIAGRIGALPLSRDEKNKNYRGFTRKLGEADRRFVVAFRRVVERIKGPTTCHREKICKALKIKGRMYRLRLNGLPK